LPSEACVKNATDCVNLMQGGHQFVKMRSNSRVYNRLYWLDDANNCLRWEPSKKDSGKARIEISSVEVRPGKATELFLTSDIATHFNECSFSIIVRRDEDLDLIANSADEANVWGLRCLMSGQDMDGLRMRTDLRDSWLGSTFDDADINKDGLLDENESLKLITSLSGGVRELQVKQKLQEYLQLRGRDKSLLSRDEFIEIFKDVATRPEIYFLLARYASGDDRLTLDDLLLFLESEQGMTGVTHEYCTSLIHDFEPSETMRAIPALGIDGFTKFLMSDRCGVFDQKHTKVCQDMSQPLSHYFISSSHNTYLMEDQVNGPSSVSAYVRALLRCCRCVELDCWDGPDGLPVVSHGHTPTNKISFRQVIEAIGESAFRNSTFPVILCIENHCSEAQQTTMATDIRQVLGERVYTQDLSSESSHLPSPGALQRRFLIRSKKLPLECTEEVGYVTDEDEGSEIDQVGEIPIAFIEAERRRPLVRDLSNLVSICSCVRFVDFQGHERIHKCSATSSLHEQDAAKLVENEAGDFVNHNKTYLTRVYPSGARMDSSNFNPQDYWNCGVQIASLNYQTPGLMMDINDGRFAMNGACGYVLKPIMRDKLAYYSCQPRDTIPGVSPKMLHLRVISGQNFPKPRGGGAKGHVIDPYVLIELFGLPNDCSEQRTRTAPNNSGDSPLFDESFEFRLSLPSLALVRFVVLDDEFIGDEFIGQYTIPFECLLPGYRHLRLRSIFDEPLDGATLFVHVAITEPDTAGKRSSAGKRARKGRSKKETEVFSVKEIGLPTVDDIFKTALTPLKCATNLMDTQRWSLAHFRETCGMAPLASPKQCVRALAQRARSDADVPQICIRRRDLRLSLELRGATPTNETWRKTGLAFDALVADAQAIIDKGAVVGEALSTACKKASKIYEKPSKSNLRKKLSVSGDSERRARRNVDENFRWNYSVVKGANESLNESRRSAETLLADLWSAAVQYGVANKEQEPTSAATTPEAPSNGVESNRNGNNNSPT
uniref:Phosphoinositide phospholipase C n=1 Tax=Ciona savignyi TaxID=51511 RepID=H2Z2T5_CIOSA